MSYFNNKTVWVTGASSGIGKAIALEASAQGAHLVISSRKESDLILVKDLCKNSQVDILPLDLADHQGLANILNENRVLLSNVDVLINNAGISQRSVVQETGFEVYKKLMEVNYLGTVLISKAVLPVFLKRGNGHFVTITSMAGKFGVPLRSGYSASKMALHGFFEALRAEISGTDVKITMVCPGYIRTDISKNALTGDGSPQGTMDEAQLNGMDVKVMARKVLSAVASGKEVYNVGGFKEVYLADIVSRWFPRLFRKIIANSKVT